MEINDQSLSLLRELLVKVLSPDNQTRKGAEEYLKSHEIQQGFPLLILTLIDRLCNTQDFQERTIVQAAAVLFKNLVKNRWERTENDDDNFITINQNDKEVIKNHLIELMCSAPELIQKQLAEAVTLISKTDFPEKWSGLLPHLVKKLNTADIQITKGVMLTANSIMKRFRYVYRSDALYSEILICLEGFKIPLMEKYQANNILIANNANNKEVLTVLMETQRLMTRIFFSLNWQDIPEFFEDNVIIWMTEFAKYMEYKNPILIDEDDENEPGPIEKLNAAIIENLNLYATKYEDIFEPFLPQFTQLIWKLLIEVGSEQKYDILATNAIKFLTIVGGKQMNVGLFSDAVLRDIVEQIVVKNLTATEHDEELFEDNAIDYIRKDMEGSDQDTRRRCASELVRSLSKFFNNQITELCKSYIEAMLQQYQVQQNWKAKDAALHLVLAVAVKTNTITTGANELNPNINLLGIFETHVIPEIHDVDVNARPIVKADSIKLVCIFRSHLQTPYILALFPHLIRHLQSKHIVIQTYAAMCIERFLTVKEKDTNGKMNLKITKEMIFPFVEPLFAGLFAVLENPDLAENDYVMKCVMRLLSVLGSDIIPVTHLVLSKLTGSLERVCKNPINPHYNHYIFESLAILIRSCCNRTLYPNITEEGATAAVAQFEVLLFPPFQMVLQQDVAEFIPYVFQILAQLLCSRDERAGLSEAYRALFPPLLSPVLWERRGNVPALTDLFIAYMNVGMSELVAGNHLTPILGVFQKLLASKATEVYSFSLLCTLVSKTPLEAITPFLPTILNLILHRMQLAVKDTKTTRFCKLFLHFLCLFCAVYGPMPIYEALEGITPGLVANIVQNIWSHNVGQSQSLDPVELKQMMIGATRLMLETPIKETPVFVTILQYILALMSTNTDQTEDLEFILGENENLEFDSTYSKLAFANVPPVDPTKIISSGPGYFAGAFVAFMKTNGQYMGVVQTGLTPEEGVALQGVLQSQGASL